MKGREKKGKGGMDRWDRGRKRQTPCPTTRTMLLTFPPWVLRDYNTQFKV